MLHFVRTMLARRSISGLPKAQCIASASLQEIPILFATLDHISSLNL